jgi:hypothetical protein
MNREELHIALQSLNIDPQSYSLYGDLISDSIILYQNYNQWEVFYLDDRGGRNNENIFYTEKEWRNYIFEQLTN